MLQRQPPLHVHAIAYVSTVVIFAGMDFVWLTATADYLYRPILGDMLAAQPRMIPAILFYLGYAAGLTYLAVRPGLLTGSVRTSAIQGAAVGFTAYATYDLTNHATLKNWSAYLTVTDLIWGTVLSAFAAALASLVAGRFFPANR
ncbi:DUF2177 family protein [Neorhizobium lilium]|uniref:DUF2177 family protein n=1 Tax=Neorhizobium lilium TaxID=2503024 RepID=A0A3S3RHK3_9HYPH|nr:DUF2177 family protein [Neorhizobium lilium]